jgi:hypothetical protein
MALNTTYLTPYSQNSVDALPDFSLNPIKSGNDLFQIFLESRASSNDGPKEYELSGLELTDKSLHKFIDILENIYISDWYNKFSKNPIVPRKIRHILCFMIKKVSLQLQKIDWQKHIFEDG